METKITEKAKEMVIGHTVSSLPEEWNGVTYAEAYDHIMAYVELPEDLVFCEQYDYLNLADMDIVKRQLEDFYDSLYRNLFEFAIEILETKKLLPEKPEVQATVEGGIIQYVASNVPGLEFRVFDTDTDGIDKGEMSTVMDGNEQWKVVAEDFDVDDESGFIEIVQE